MFIREFKIRSNNQIKSSDKKNLIKEILIQYPSIKEEDLKELIKIKESEICFSKIVTHDSIDVIVYQIDKIPYLFKIDKDDRLIPTVYFLWKFPDLFTRLFTHKEVFNKLANGADFMLPGVITQGPVNLYTFKHINKNDLCSLCISGNNAPIAIGQTYLSGEDMYMSGMKGKCLKILHIYHDNLWSMGDKSIPIPIMPVTNPNASQANFQESKNEINENKQPIKTDDVETKLSNVQLTEESTADSDSVSKLNIDENSELNNKPPEDEQSTAEEAEKALDHEEILLKAFLTALKFKSKEFKVPVIVSTFIKTMQNCNPPGVQYDLKKTRYKKISDFLKEMEKQGVVKTKEIQKGVLSITEINKENELLKYHKKPEWLKEQQVEINEESVQSMFEVYEMFKIDGNTEGFFRNEFRKGDVVNSGQVRQYVMNYIKEHNLQLKNDPKYLEPNELIYKTFIKNKQIDKVGFDDLFSNIFSKLGPMHLIKRIYSDRKDRDSGYLRKGKFQPIEFKLETRGAGKKVTKILNLNAFELDANDLQAKIRKDLGCSVSIENPLSAASSSASSSNDYVLCIQDDIGIQFKHMQGLELGSKGPNKQT